MPEDWPADWLKELEKFTADSNYLYHESLEALTPILGRKRAKESARFFKTYNSQITADVQFNMRSFANFLKLRASEHAQVEIRDIAWEMFRLVDTIEGDPFRHTLEMIKP
jgi:thymidylate synthase ThyX